MFNNFFQLKLEKNLYQIFLKLSSQNIQIKIKNKQILKQK